MLLFLCRNDESAAILDFRPRLANRCSRGAILGRNRAVILDFKPRLANRCSLGADLWQNRASILDFRPRLANRCSQEAKTRANRASILDFKPRLANRCSKEVKTGAIPPSQGLKHCAAAEECRMGRDFGRRSRPWLREREGPAAQRREGKHRRCAPVRSPCPQADSDAGTRPPARRQTRTREHGPLPAGSLRPKNPPQAAFAQRIPRRQPPPRESPAGRSGRGAETISCGSAAR